ncbi:uncharacterized protein LOC113466544 [Diaphorina citri]|uniref:Uncharacterized protein LOC113466544 n=1 Tax=Diaphorina citri TaxID=121845 RepID=A0A3Q0IT82_DIACI|nr:uncharacterized protein LOC113466544 [Diaphorina citri]
MMKLRILVLIFLISWHETLCGVVSVDDCTEPGAHRYHAHSSHSAAYTSGYSQQHPAPIGHSATSSSYMRTGNAASSRYTQGEADDLQVASSYYSPSVATGFFFFLSSDIRIYRGNSTGEIHIPWYYSSTCPRDIIPHPHNLTRLVVPVRVTVTREHTVLPGGVTSQQQESSYTSHSSSTQPHTVTYVQSGNTAGSADSSYSYNAQGVKVAPQVYTVGSQGSVYIPEGSSVSHQHQSNVRQDNVIVPGAVPILNSEEALRKSNKLFDLVSGYGTFLPAKEEEHVEKSSSSSIKSGSQYGSQSQYSVRGEHESSAEYHSRVTGSGGEYHRVSGVTYQPSASSGSGTGYQGVIPAGGGVKKTTTVYSSYSSNQGLGSQISPGVPVGDTINPPEVSGSYFSAGGAGGRQGYTTRTGYATSGGYGVRNENYGYSGASRDAALSSGYGVKSSGLSSSYAANANTLASGYAANANRDAALTQNLALNRDYTAVCPTVCPVIEPNCILPVCDTSTGGVKKYGISSSWSSKSQTVNGKTTESKQAQVTVNDNGKIDTYSTHNRK